MINLQLEVLFQCGGNDVEKLLFYNNFGRGPCSKSHVGCMKRLNTNWTTNFGTSGFHFKPKILFFFLPLSIKTYFHIIMVSFLYYIPKCGHVHKRGCNSAKSNKMNLVVDAIMKPNCTLLFVLMLWQNLSYMLMFFYGCYGLVIGCKS
jgi:hypothetical protein